MRMGRKMPPSILLSARRRRRSLSSSLAPMAADSSMPIRPILSKIRRRLSNFLEMLAILLIPAALCYTFGEMVGDRRQGWAILAAMSSCLSSYLACHVISESAKKSSVWLPWMLIKRISEQQSGGNMEGKETRFGIVNSADLVRCHDGGVERIGQLDA